MKILAVLFSVMVFSMVSVAHAQESEPIILEQVSPSGQVLVKLEWPELYPDEIKTFKLSFHDPKTGKLLDNLRLNYNVEVTQHDHPVEHYMHNLADRTGTGEFEVLFPQESDGPAKVIVELRVANDKAGTMYKYNETVEFDVMVVPEFGIIAGIVLAAAIVPILLLSKSRLHIRY